MVCALRRATNFALDDLSFVVCHFLPHLNRHSIGRILKAEGLSRRPKSLTERPSRGQGTFKDDDPGFVHIDIKHLPKLQTANGERRKRYLCVAIDRCSRSVHLAVKDDETEQSASGLSVPPHLRADRQRQLLHARLRQSLRRTRGGVSPHQTLHTADNGMVERFNGRVGSEVLGITLYSHQDLEELLRGFNAAYNARRQHVLNGKTPDQIVAERLKARRKLANAKPHGRTGPDDIAKARRIAEAAKEVSQPDT